MAPIKLLLQSRKFLLLILDTVISLSLFFVGKYAPIAFEDVQTMILALQPVFVSVIGGIAYEDAHKIPFDLLGEDGQKLFKLDE